MPRPETDGWASGSCYGAFFLDCTCPDRLRQTLERRGIDMGEPSAAAAGFAAQGVLSPERPLSIALIRPASMLPGTAQNAVLEVAPIGLAYLAAGLGQAGHRVRVIDAFGEAVGQLNIHEDGYTTNGLTADGIVARIPRDVDLIGVTCMFS